MREGEQIYFEELKREMALNSAKSHFEGRIAQAQNEGGIFTYGKEGYLNTMNAYIKAVEGGNYFGEVDFQDDKGENRQAESVYDFLTKNSKERVAIAEMEQDPRFFPEYVGPNVNKYFQFRKRELGGPDSSDASDEELVQKAVKGEIDSKEIPQALRKRETDESRAAALMDALMKNVGEGRYFDPVTYEWQGGGKKQEGRDVSPYEKLQQAIKRMASQNKTMDGLKNPDMDFYRQNERNIKWVESLVSLLEKHPDFKKPEEEAA